MQGGVMDMCFPGTYRVCGRILILQEKMLCLQCLYDLPRTYHWLFPGHAMTGPFSCMAACTGATSFLFFREASPYRKLLHRFKYCGERKSVCIWVFLYGKGVCPGLAGRGKSMHYSVPMSSGKRRKRGYNQAGSGWLQG